MTSIEVQETIAPCRVCGNSSGNRPHVVREMMFGTREPFPYVECAACGCLQIEMVPADLSPYYRGDYYSLQVSPETWQPSKPSKRKLMLAVGAHDLGHPNPLGWLVGRRFPHWRPPLWTRMATVRRSDSVLDVGCGSGVGLLHLAEYGFRDLLGVDPFAPRDLTYLNGVRVMKRLIGEVGGRFSVILFDHVFEHLAEPEADLAHARRLLHEGGRVVIRTPLAGKAAWKTYGTNWFAIDAPRHLIVHTEKSLALIAERAGLTVKSVVYDSDALQFLISENYARDIPLIDQGEGKTYTRDERRRLEKKAAALNESGDGDSATFVLSSA